MKIIKECIIIWTQGMRAFNVTLRQAQGDCHGELVEPCLSNYAHVNNFHSTLHHL
jgi:hypothetical protein